MMLNDFVRKQDIFFQTVENDINNNMKMYNINYYRGVLGENVEPHKHLTPPARLWSDFQGSRTFLSGKKTHNPEGRNFAKK